jgi:hypothetical protein
MARVRPDLAGCCAGFAIHGFEASVISQTDTVMDESKHSDNGLIGSLYCLFLGVLLALLLGCGSGSKSSTGGQQLVIVSQPTNQSAPLGQTATFSVTVSGQSPITYQWSENGNVIQGAIASSYTTPPVSTQDIGATFTVAVTNTVGSLMSQSAALTVAPRAPLAGDLRFQQFDSPSTINGYTGIELINLLANTQLSYPNATGTPLSIGPGCLGDTLTTVYACGWLVNSFSLPNGVTGLSTYYQSGFLEDFQSELSTISSTNGVVTGLNIEPAYDSYAASWITTAQPGGFNLTQNVVAPASLQEAATQQGQLGRVITAVSYDNGQITYLSYGWQEDASTAYEVQVVTATFDTVASSATSLAASGYIITALGGTNTDGLILVGTRVKGDSIGRPLMIIQAGQSPALLSEQGYAVVGFLVSSIGEPLWVIGEK